MSNFALGILKVQVSNKKETYFKLIKLQTNGVNTSCSWMYARGILYLVNKA
jgi:hypothetical protein